ncbi:MAG: PQQ-dependent sugar dehydrogenase [Phycisphaerales bacterium]|nr:MAG: PQQ-dependent sugar dehydrogenase [Phycisphaerales bacterium]
MDPARFFLRLAGAIAVLFSAAGSGAAYGFEMWEISEVFSNDDGSVQFIELVNNTGAVAEGLLGGRTFTSNSQVYIYPGDLTGDTAFKKVLMGTSGFAALSGAPAPDYIIPDRFFDPGGDTLVFVSGTQPYRSLTFGPGELATDGVHSLNRDPGTGAVVAAENSPANFAGVFGTVSGPLADPIPQKIEKGPVGVELESVAVGLAAPVHVTDAGDGTNRLFVVDQRGEIRIIRNGTLVARPLLDVSDRLVRLGIRGTFDENDYDERGLLGLAFHPDFGNSEKSGYGKLYTYTSEPVEGTADFTVPMPDGVAFNHQSVIAEWVVDVSDGNVADVSSRREIMRIDQPQFNHNGGMLCFGPDGYLYISLGDGGGANDTAPGHGTSGNGQNPGNVLGSILRIDVDGNNSPNGRYGIPDDNPFVGDPKGLDEIYAYGFRNPFRFSFDSHTGELIVGDVGQNMVEEIDIVTAGGNYGWNLKEGGFRFDPATRTVSGDLRGLPSGLIDPAAQYDHDEGITVIGGYVYRGTKLPALSGQYVFADFSSGFFTAGGRLLYADLGTGEIRELVLGLDDREPGLFMKGFGQGGDGELYVLAGTNLGPFGGLGQVLRIKGLECTPGQAHVIPGDVNRDCRVDFGDFAVMALHWLECAPGPQVDCGD